MKVSELRESRFLSKEDCTPAILVTIVDCSKQNMAMEGQAAEMKACLTFAEPGVKPMVLNSTNGQIIEKILGSDETDNWRGKKIVLYNDPTIQFAGRVTGGIRARAPKQAAAAPRPVPAPTSHEDLDEDVPF